MNCPNCNNPLPDGAKFCGSCGKSVPSQTLAEEKTTQIPVKNTSPQSAAKIVRKSSQIIAVILLLGLFSSYSSSQTTHPTGILGIIYDICYIFSVIMGIALLSEWWKNRKSDKQWFGRRWIIFVIVLSAVGLATMVINQSLITARQNVANAEWVVYNAPVGNFSAEFPSDPVHTVKSQGTDTTAQIDSYMQADNTASVMYGVNVSVFPQGTDLSDPVGMLKNTVTLSAKNGTVLNSNQTTNNGYPAISYYIEFDHPNEISMIKGLNVLVGNHLYQLLTAYDKPQENLLQYDKFVDSFQIN